MRADLLNLSSEKLALLANPGLVKRAQRELAAGQLPAVHEDAQGCVHAQFGDGACTQLPPGAPLRDSMCSCAARTVCRHRVATVLAYQQGARARQAPAEPWDPGAVDDVTVAACCSTAALARARASLRHSCLVTLTPGSEPLAALPCAQVRFLVPNSLAHARCDCALGHGCEHIALAVWAFRRAPGGGLVDLGPAYEAAWEAPLTQIDATLSMLAQGGLWGLGSAQSIGRARALADRAGLHWVTAALEELEQQHEAYQRQSAVFCTRTCAALIAELTARARAARGGHDLPVRWILGVHEARKSPLHPVRLLPVGTRLHADGQHRFASLYFVDPAAAQVLVVRKRWRFATVAAAPNGAQLARRVVTRHHSLLALASGDLQVQGAAKRANATLDLAGAQVAPAGACAAADLWRDLPEPVLVPSLAAHAARTAQGPPRLLCQRHAGEALHVIAVGQVLEMTYATAAQELRATLCDAEGTPFTVHLAHRSVSPGAVDALHAALAARPTRVAGLLRHTRTGWQLDPLAVPGKRLCIPDLESPPQAPGPALPEAPGHPPMTGTDGLLHDLQSWLQRGLHQGVSGLRTCSATLAQQLQDGGMARVGVLVQRAGQGDPRALLDASLVYALLQP